MIFLLNEVIKYRKKVWLLFIVVVVVDSITAHKNKDLDSKEIMSDPDPRDPNVTGLSDPDPEHCLTHTWFLTCWTFIFPIFPIALGQNK
jgi:hypothetical protein